MPCVKRSLFLLAVVAFLTFFPKVTFAESTCECFCGESDIGATDQGSMTNAACQTNCSEIDTQFVGCFTDPQFYPDRNPKCWTQDECSTWQGLNGTTVVKATWQDGDMPYDCMRTKTSLEPRKYCYADDASYTLNVPIGSVTEIQNLPTYINTIYTWLLPAASLIAVVMLMIGGLQYVLSRGKSKYIEKAKTRITNAITGLVLLLAVFVILNLIDPRLTALNTLKIPMIKEITLLDAASSCERLDDYGYAIEEITAPDSCGGKGRIKGLDDDFPDDVLGAWKVGDECEYMVCKGADANKVCLSNAGVNSCQSCASIPNPSESVCASVQRINSGTNGQTMAYCVYEPVTKSCVTAGTDLTKHPGFYCGTMRTAADEEGSTPDSKAGCSVYEDLQYQYSLATGDERILGSNAITANETSAKLLEEICNKDLCKVAESVGGSQCFYHAGTGEGVSQFAGEVIEDLWGVKIDYLTKGYYCSTYPKGLR